jgi:hypothetical protein
VRIWEWDTLETMEEASRVTGIEAKGISGLLYRPFFNGRFGPQQAATDKDVTVPMETQVTPYLAELRRLRPRIRWSVASAESKIGVADIVRAHRRHLLRYRRGSIWMERGEVCLDLPEGTGDDLEAGVLQVDETRLGSNHQLEGLADRAKKTLDEYPMLRVVGALADWLPVPPVTPKKRRDSVWFEKPPTELYAALCRLPRYSEAPPPPDLSTHPGPFSLTEALLLPDAPFREWFLQQVRSRTPIGGRDPELAQLLSVPLGEWRPLRHQRLLLLQTDDCAAHRRRLRRALLAEQNPACDGWTDEKPLSDASLWEDCTAALLHETGHTHNETQARQQAAFLPVEQQILLRRLWRARTAADSERRWLLPLEPVLHAWIQGSVCSPPGSFRLD